MKKIVQLFVVFVLSFIFLTFIVFFDFWVAIIFGGRVQIFNHTNETFSGKIEFFQHKHFLHSENFKILQYEKKKFSVPDEFSDGEIKIFIENENGKQEFIFREDYLYSFNVDEKVVIKKENGILKLE